MSAAKSTVDIQKIRSYVTNFNVWHDDWIKSLTINKALLQWVEATCIQTENVLEKLHSVGSC